MGDDDRDEEEEDAAAPPSVETHPKRTTSFVARLTHKSPVHYDLATRIAMERENNKYWARILLLFPLAPVCVALTTVVIGGAIINAATNKCNSSLMTFMQGAVALSYVLIWFYAYCWMGPKPIKSLRTVRVFYLIYGLVCFVWWGIYGTLQAVNATSSGFESCLSMSPTLYIMSQYEVAVFWILLLVFAGFVVNERTAKLRQEKMKQWTRRATRKAKTEEELAEEATQANVLEATQEKARQAEEEQRKKILKEQDHLYGESEGEDGEEDGGDAFDIDQKDEEASDGEAGDEEEEKEEEEEEEILLSRVQESPLAQAKSHYHRTSGSSLPPLASIQRFLTITLTHEEQAHYDRVVGRLLYRAVQEYTNYGGSDGANKVNRNLWAQVCKGSGMRAYRNLKGTGDPRVSLLLGLGKIDGSLEDVMNKLYSDTLVDLCTAVGVLSPRFIAGSVLYLSKTRTLGNPFNLAAIKWFAMKTPGGAVLSD